MFKKKIGKCAWCGVPIDIPEGYNLDYIQCPRCAGISQIKRGL